MHLTFHSSPKRAWTLVPTGAREGDALAWACGWAVDEQGSLLDAQGLGLALLKTLERDAPLAGLFKGWRGNWALAWQARGKAGLAADHIRGIPLIYRHADGVLEASDELDLLRRKGSRVDNVSALEFAAAGYVTGPNTLFRDIRGVQAGEAVLAGADRLERVEWTAHRCAYDREAEPRAFFEDHARVVERAVSRALSGLDGRQIVIPLSGGLDSRLVAAAVARLGRTDALCFTYGLEDNFEARTAQATAERLGLAWKPVAYEPGAIRQALGSQDFARYQAFASTGISCPHPDDWLAVHLLREQGDLRPDAVFFPGHTGDFICGSHLKYLFDPEEQADPLDFDAAMVRKHYGLWDRLARDQRCLRAFSGRLAQAVGGIGRDTETGVAAAYEFWEWRERQAKFIVNSVRVYEHFGYGWRIPLWDPEVMAFWTRPSIGLKLDKYLYRACLVADDPFGVFVGEERPRFDRDKAAAKVARKAQKGSRRLRRALARLPLVGRLAWYLSRVKVHRRLWRRHPSGFAGAVGRFRYVYLDPGKRHVVALLARDNLLRLTGLRPKGLPGSLDE